MQPNDFVEYNCIDDCGVGSPAANGTIGQIEDVTDSGIVVRWFFHPPAIRLASNVLPRHLTVRGAP